MRLDTELLHTVHLAVETALAGLIWVLLRRIYCSRKRLVVLEAEVGLVKKRFEAATAGFHIRLLHLEQQTKRAAAAVAVAGIPHQGNRGEYELRMKIRQLTAAIPEPRQQISRE
jgi:hypothetical protein